MLEIETNLLWVGNAREAREPRGLYEVGIQAVVDVAFEELPAQLPRDLVYLRVPLSDGGGNEPAMIRLAVDSVRKLLQLQIPTLIVCSAGVSRSPTVASFALGLHQGKPPAEILEQIASKRSVQIHGVLWNAMSQVYFGTVPDQDAP